MNRFAHHIAGEWVGSDDYVPNVNPSNTNDVIGEYASGTNEHALSAIASARQAAHAWSQTTPQFRADVLDRVGEELAARSAQLGNLLAQEEGKTLPEAIAEAVRASKIFKFFAGEALRAFGECIPSIRESVRVEVMREPLGVVAIITPWNYPLAIPAWKIAPALAFGNCVVFKPAELTPGCAWWLTKILVDAGVPKGVFNLVMGSGARLGEAIASSQEVDAISFTGSGATGQKVKRAALDTWARLQLELGGKNPLVVLNDAEINHAVNCAIQGAFYSAGQRCTASSRVIVTAGIHDEFVDRLVDATQNLVVADARRAGSQIGPLVDGRQLDSVLGYVALGRAEGAALLTGGELCSDGAPGFFMRPAVFADANASMRIATRKPWSWQTIRSSDSQQGYARAHSRPRNTSKAIVRRA